MADDAEERPGVPAGAAENGAAAPELQPAADNAEIVQQPPADQVPPAAELDDQLAHRRGQERGRWQRLGGFRGRIRGGAFVGFGGGRRLMEEEVEEEEDARAMEDWEEEEEMEWRRHEGGFDEGFGGFGGGGAGFGGGFGGGQRLGGGWRPVVVEPERPPAPHPADEQAEVPVEQMLEEDFARDEANFPDEEVVRQLIMRIDADEPLPAEVRRDRREQRREQLEHPELPAHVVRERALHQLQGVVQELLEVRDDLQRMQLDGRRAAISAEMIGEADTMGREDVSNPSTARYTRACDVCGTENPRKRAVFTKCGHIVCYPCAVKNATGPHGAGKCVFCRTKSGFVKIFENEVEIEKEVNETEEDNQDGE